MSESAIITLSPEQLKAVAHLLNRDQNIIAELRLASLPGQQSAAHVFVRAISAKEAAVIRRVLGTVTPEKPEPTPAKPSHPCLAA